MQKFFETRQGRDLLIRNIGASTQTMTVDLGDHVMTFSPSDYIGRSLFVKGHFDRDHATRLVEILKQRNIRTAGKVLLELGGNIGTHTVYFALTKAFERILTVEPDPRNFPLLRTNVAQNGFADRVIAVNCAVGDREGDIDFYLHPTNHGKSATAPRSADDTRISVPVRPVSRVLADAGLSAADIGLVWMDIEGYEPVAIAGMRDLLARRVPIYTEFSPEYYGAEQAAAFVAHLAEFYEDCLVFFEDVQTPMKVCDIPIGPEQLDILLLP
jgi:FkbM family methyltransferase